MVTELRPAADTASLESPDTAPPVVEAQPTGTESAPAAVATDSARVPEATETADPLADFDEELVKASPKVKALLEATEKSVTARSEESHRQQLAAERQRAETQAAQEAYGRQVAELDEVERGSVLNTLAEVVDRVALGDPEARTRLQADLPALRAMAETLTRSTHTRLDRQNVETLNSYLADKFPDYRIAPEQVASFDAALSKGDFTARRNIEYDLVAEAAVAKEVDTRVAAKLRELKADAEKQLENERAKTTEAAAQNGARPTTVAGRPAAVGSYRSLAEVSAAHVRGELTNQQVQAYRAMPRSQMPEF